MKQGSRGMVSMEALALISALCIVAIFVFAHYSRQAAVFDDQARVLSRDLKPQVEAFFQANPQDRLSAQGLATLGVAIPAPMQATVTPMKDRAQDWQVVISHPQGKLRFVISASGIAEDFR